MNVIQAIQEYITRIVSSIPGMKVLVLDTETTGIVSMVYSQSAILQKEVYLFEKLETRNRETMAHLKAVCLLRGTPENARLLQDELRDPKYMEYHLFFTNIVKSSFLEDIAQADEHEKVQQVQEYYADYYAVNSDLFTFNVPAMLSTTDRDFLVQGERVADGICALALSLRKRPFIRFQRTSELCQRVAQEVTRKITTESELFDFRRAEVPPIVLVIDRREDPVTPLLLQWTYQAMVNEIIGIHNNRVDMAHVPGIRDDLREIVLSPDQDQFYRDSMFLNFGDLGAAVKELVETYRDKSKGNQNIQSLEDIKRFVENYPEFRKMSGNVSKHVAVMSELSRQIELRQLLRVSELQQELACNHDPATAFPKIIAHIQDRALAKEDILKCVMLYALRYEEGGRLSEVFREMEVAGFGQSDIDMVNMLLRYAGARMRSFDLFSIKNIWERTRTAVKRSLKVLVSFSTCLQCTNRV
ncbi:vacuolar protein sorting-associated protein 45 [Pelomyxa schiedti]|nr:vacuolar protein sorting-associated protein 45 [Pelomyxa schiedti]